MDGSSDDQVVAVKVGAAENVVAFPQGAAEAEVTEAGRHPDYALR